MDRKFLILIVSIVMLIFTYFTGLALAIKCDKESFENLLKAVYGAEERDIEYKVISVERFADLDFCEAVYIVEPFVKDPRVPVFKNIAYFRDNYLIFGALIKVEGEKVVQVTNDKFREINKEIIDQLEKTRMQGESKQEEIKEYAKKHFDEFKKKADVVWGKEAKAEIISFIDPKCPHCEEMKNLILKKTKENKVKAYFIFAPVLGEESVKIATSVLCDKKTNEEKLKAYTEKYISKPCDKGLKKIEENIQIAKSLGFRGVPFNLLKKGESIEMITGALPEEVFDNLLK